MQPLLCRHMYAEYVFFFICMHEIYVYVLHCITYMKTLSMYLYNESTNGVKGRWSERERAGGHIEKSLPCPIYVHILDKYD